MKAMYPAVFIPEEKGEYTVIFPDLKGCITCGDNLEHAMIMAQEVLGLYIVSLEEHKDEIPQASDISTLELEPDSFTTLVITEVNQYRRNKSVNKMVTLPVWLKESAEQAHINFSGVLQEALKQKLDVM